MADAILEVIYFNADSRGETTESSQVVSAMRRKQRAIQRMETQRLQPKTKTRKPIKQLPDDISESEEDDEETEEEYAARQWNKRQEEERVLTTLMRDKERKEQEEASREEGNYTKPESPGSAPEDNQDDYELEEGSDTVNLNIHIE
jgi:hypothetical protein